MSGNLIHVIDDEAFWGLNNLSSLTLSHCGLNEVPPLGPVKSNLEILRLPSNCLIVIPGDNFYGFARLRFVSLDFHKILVVPNVTPLKATLHLLELDGNQIASFEPFLSNTTFPILRHLTVISNNITYLSRDMLSCWPILVRLYLVNNLLKSLEDLSGVIRVPSASLMVKYSSYLIRYHDICNNNPTSNYMLHSIGESFSCN